MVISITLSFLMTISDHINLKILSQKEWCCTALSLFSENPAPELFLLVSMSQWL